MKKVLTFIFIGVVFLPFLSCSALFCPEAGCSKNVFNQVYYLNGSFVENGNS